VLRIVETRIGLEGETRVCAATRDAAAAQGLLEEAQRAAQGAELFNVVAEPCSGP
jgi:hypothetical protein